MCIAYHRNRKNFARAEELINGIPASRIDKEEQLASLYTHQGKLQEAQQLWENRILQSASAIRTALLQLLEIAERENRSQDADCFADIYKQLSQLLQLAPWIACGGLFQLAILRQDSELCQAALSELLPALKEPWIPKTTSLYRHMKKNSSSALSTALHTRLLEDLRTSEEFAFFRNSPLFHELLLDLDQQETEPRPER